MSILSQILGSDLQDPLGLYRQDDEAKPGRVAGIEPPTQRAERVEPQQVERAAQPAAEPQPQNDDFNDLVNTVIAEAGGEGPEGMAAVASVIKNRSERRGKAPGDIVRAPHQFAGYSDPGSASVQAQRDPRLRAQAEQIVRGVFDGQIPDQTGGADHFYSGDAAPDWASTMPETARIGGHAFFNSGGGGHPVPKETVPPTDRGDGRPQDAGRPGDVRQGADGKSYQYVETRGMAGSTGDFGWIPVNGGVGPRGSDNASAALDRLAQPQDDAAASKFLKSRLVGHSDDHIDNMQPVLRERLAYMMEQAPADIAGDLGIFSGARSVERQTQLWNAALKKYGSVAAARKWVAPPPGVAGSKGSRHNDGVAADLSYKGKSLAHAPAEVVAWVHDNAKEFGLAFPLGNEPWHVETAEARGGKASADMGSRSEAPKRKTIQLDDAFKASDPMGLYRDRESPFASKAPDLRPFNPDEQRPNADGSYSTEISTTWQLPDGKWVNVPSLWMGADGPKQFDPADEEGILGTMQRWEQKNGQTFPRFGSAEEADAAAQARSAAGGAGSPAQSPVDQIWKGLEAKEPGRYKVIDAAQAENWRGEWEKSQSNQFMKGLKGALVDQNPELLGNAMDAIGVLTDNGTVREIAGTVRDWAETGSFSRQARVGSVGDIRTDSVGNFISDATDYAAYALGSGLGSMAPSLAIGTAATAATANPIVGFVAGASGPSYVQNLGDVYGALRDDPNIKKRVAAGELTEKQLAGWAAAAAVPMAALDTWGLGRVAHVAGADVKGSLIRRISTGLAKGMLTEGTTEGLQEVVSQSVQEALGADKSLAEQALAVADNAIGGALAGGAVSAATSVRGRPEVAAEGQPATPQSDAAPAQSDGSGYGQTYVVNDSATDTMPAGEMDGQMVRAAPDQSKAPTNMVVVEAADGSRHIIGKQLLVPATGGEAAAGPDAATEAPPSPAQQGRGPLARALQEGQRRNAEAAGAINSGDTAPAMPAADAGRPAVGATVRVDAEGIPPFMARIESFEGDEALVYDSSSGEVYQLPLETMTPIAPPAGEFAAQGAGNVPAEVGTMPSSEPTPPTSPPGEHVPTVMTRFMRDRLGQLGYDNTSIREMTPETAHNIIRAADNPVPVDPNDAALEPQEPAAAETTAELPPASEQKPASEAFPGPPPAGQRVIVDAPGVERFSGRIERYEDVDGNQEAVVVNDSGTSMQVPLDNLFVSKLSKKDVEAENLRREPPAEREPAVSTELGRKIGDKTVVMPDDKHARLFDLGKMRMTSKILGGTSTLDMDAAMPAEQRKLATEFGVTPAAVGQIADDYRYRVERTGKEGRSKLPIKMHPVNERLLKQRQADLRKAEPTAAPAGNDLAVWWDGELTAPERKVILDKTGVKRSEKMMWRSMSPAIREKLATQRVVVGSGNERAAVDENWMPEGARYPDTLDNAVHEAATSPKNNLPEPSQAQKEAGNYKVGRMRFGGLDLSIENPEGSERKGVDRGGKAWSVEMKSHYGYIRGTVGRDKDHIDVFVNPRLHTAPMDASPVFVVDQNVGSSFDEHKVMLGFGSSEEAREAYLENYKKGWKGLNSITPSTMGEFKAWLADGDTSKPFARARAPEPAAVAKKPTAKRLPSVDRAENFFRPGRVVKSYAGFDKVLSFDRGEGGNWNVTVQASDAGGTVAPDTRVRNHTTIPSERELAAWERDNPVPVVDKKARKSAPVAEVAAQPVVDNKKDWGASNKLVTQDRADEIRKKLREKLRGQISAGIDPEILALGTELAAFHIEAGARRFADFARAVAADMGAPVEKLRPFLRAWYNGARDLMEDSGVDIAGTDDANTVRAELARLKEEGRGNEPSELDGSGEGTLEGIPADAVQSPAKRRQVERSAPVRSGPDLFGNEPARAERVSARRSVPDGQGELPVPARGRLATESAGVDDSGDAEGVRRRSADFEDRVDYPTSAATPAAQRAVDYTLSDADELGAGGTKAKFRQNVAAVRLLRTLNDEHRPATRDEQSVLAKWVGWGGLRAAFAREDGTVAKGWDKEAAELKELLTPEEYRAAESSTRNAHYTSPEIVRAIWDIARRVGFSGGQVLEPSVGAGNFVGMMPGRWRDVARVTGVELDPITGGIAKNLYPHANIQAPVGFQNLTVPDGHFDLVVGNPPFGSERLYDADRRHLNKFSIHNFFFAKAIDGLKPNGVLAMVVTNYFMDAADAKARAYIAARADLLGAIRLPNNAFLQNAGTEVTTDIIVLKKRPEGTPAADLTWVDSTTFKDKEGREVPLNRYFKKHPDMMLGDFGAYGTMYRGNEAALVARDDDDLPSLLKSAILALPENVMDRPGSIVVPEAVAVPESVNEAQIGSVFLSPDGGLFVRKPDSIGEAQAEAVSLPNETAKERVSGMVRVRDAFARLRRAQIDDRASDDKISNLRKLLNEKYDAFVKKHGPINADANRRLFRDDPTWPQIAALEDGFDKGISAAVAKVTGEAARPASARKAPIFTKRTQQPYKRPEAAATAKDALASVLADIGRVDLEAMSRLYGKPESQIVDELGPLLWRTPAGAYETADQYLSGNVKAKLAEAQRAVGQDPDFRRNVAALQDVIPADIEPVDIDVKPGAPWLPAEHVAAFVEHIAEATGAKAFYSRANAKWALTVPRSTPAVDVQWATDRTALSSILESVMNGQTISVYDKTSDGKSVLNQPATDAANEKATKVKAEWKRWLWEDDARREQLARLYNDTFNTDVLRKFDGSHLSFPGKVGDDIITFRPHQKNFIWRTLQSSTALADHVVGSGKTFELIASIMEMRRMGLARKPMLAVPNNLVGQWAADFIKLYPGAKVLAATKKDFAAENRKKLFARVATGDWDVVIIAHSSFGRIGVSPEFEAAFIREQIDDLEASIGELREATGEKSRTVSQLAKARETMQSKLQRLLDAGAKDDGMTFDELGVDALFVDEAHEFKNLAFATSMTRVAGLGNSAGSQKAADLYMKVLNVMQRTGGRNIVFATGTPLSNTMAEVFTVQRYLDGQGLRDLGVAHFDAWARVFGEVVSDWELSPSGQYKMNSRFAKFVNMPELMQRYLSFADVITNDDIKAQLAAIGKTLPLPKVKGGKPQNAVVERSTVQADYIGVPTTDQWGNQQYPVGSLVYRAEHLPKRAEKGGDNMLKVMSDARKAALDMRLIDSGHPDVRGSKVHVAADHIKRIYDRWTDKKGTQLVFIDLSTPKKAKAKEQARLLDLMKRAAEGDEAAIETVDNMSPDEFLALDSTFSVYDDLRDKLIARGIPAAEIAFAHDANTEIQKEELFGKVRAGRVRVLMGSTPKMGVGTNVQNRLVALHHLDAPWRPSDLEQRDGRGIRQGNELYGEDPDGFEIEILRYATKNTLDARQWQTIEGKARFIQQMRKGGMTTREVEDIAGEASNAAEMKAAASGNPLILEEMDLRQKLRRLEGQSAEHDREQHRIRARVRQMQRERDDNDARLSDAEADAALADKVSGEFTATIQGVKVEKTKDMGAGILSVARKMLDDRQDEAALGRYGGFALAIEYNHSRSFTVTIEGKGQHDVYLEDVKDADPVGTGMRIVNTVRRLVDEPKRIAERNAEIDKQVPALEKQIAPWADAAKLDETAARHAEVVTALRPKPTTAATVPPAGAEASIAEQPVAKLTGKELGIDFKGPDDMPALRTAAREWYDSNLRSSSATMRDGTIVRFNRRGRDKSTFGGKGDVLLRSVPAIKAIIENGEEVLRERGNRPGVMQRVIIAAPIEFAGVIKTLAVSVHRTALGEFQYDLTFDRGDRVGGPGIGARLAGDASIADGLESATNSVGSPRITRGEPTDIASPGSLDASSDSLNIFEWKPENKITALSEADKAEITEIVREISGLDDVTFTRRIDLPRGSRGWGTDTPTTAGGFYDSATDAITIAMDSGDRHTAYHEAFHRLQRLFLTEQERAVLKAEVGRLRRMVAGKIGREAQAPTMSQKELEAEAFAIYATGSAIKPHKALRAAWDRIATMIRRVRNYLTGRGFQTSEDVFDRATSGRMRLRPRDNIVGSTIVARGPFEEDSSGFDASIAPATARAAITENRVIDEVRGKLTDLQPKLLAAIPLNYFTDLARPNMTAVGEYLRVKRILDAYRGKKHAAADMVAQQWLKYARLGIGKGGKAKAAKLAELMHRSTLAGVDPSATDKESRLHPAYGALRASYMELAPTGRQLFESVRDAYKAQADELDKILLDNVRKAQEIAQKRADDQYQEELERIGAAKLSPAARKDAMEEAERSYAASSTKAKWSMKARLTKMRIAFEASRVEGPYFPLARFGRYFVTVRDVDGTVLSFSRREKAADRDRLAADMRGAYPTAKVEVGVTENGNEIRQAMDPRLITEIETIIGGAGLESTTMTTVLDQIWQRYLTTMPDLSVRKRFIHRKGTSGFDEDALRAFASHMFHAAHQMGRLKYGLELQELTNTVADQARKSDDVTRGMTLANELKLRHKWVMNPTGGKFAQTMTSAAFVWYLGVTPAAALVNISQTPMIGIPMLAGRFGSVTKAAATMLKASYDSLAGKGTVMGANLSADERAAMDAFHESGLIDKTQSHDIAGVGETGVDYSPLRARAMAIVSWAFHRTEVWNREVMALAAYRMAKEAGQNDTDAIDTAHDLTWKTHFDYSNASRPRIMQNDFFKVALVFRSYNINMLYRVFRDIHQAVKGETPQARREARYQAAGVVGMMSLLAGVTGTVGFNVMMSLAGALLGDDDDPMDFEEHFRKDVLDILGPELGGVVLNGVPGHYLGIDLAGRIGMPDLWFRSPSRDLQGKDEYEYWVMNSLGASVSMIGSAYNGISMIYDGNTAKGVEALSPKWARDLMKAYRVAYEGVTSYRGDSIIDPSNIDAWDTIAQAIGFTPAKVSETYSRNSALMNAESRVQKRRSTLVNRFALAARMGDDDGRAEAMDRIKAFNRTPLGKTMSITADTLRRSLAVRKRNADKREDGVLIENRQLGKRLREMLPEPVYR